MYADDETMRERLINRAEDIDQMRFVDEVEEKIEEVNNGLKYFWLSINDLYFRD